MSTFYDPSGQLNGFGVLCTPQPWLSTNQFQLQVHCSSAMSNDDLALWWCHRLLQL